MMFRKKGISHVRGIVSPYFVTVYRTYIPKSFHKSVNNNHDIHRNAKHTNSNDKGHGGDTDNTKVAKPTVLYPGHITTSLFQKGTEKF